MAKMMGKLYAALREAKAPETAAREAAEEAAEFIVFLNNESGIFYTDIKAEFATVTQEFAGVKGRLLLLQWMVGFNLAMTVTIIARLFLH